ncbi:STM3941 family protein [Empedobacter falsenii]
MKKGSDIIVYVVGILFTIGSLLIFIISYKKDRLSEVVQEPKSYLGFGLMAICYYLLKSKKKLNSNDATIKKTKVIATLIMSVLFVNAGLFILFSDINYNRYIPNELIKYIVGCLAIIFFGGIMIISLRTLWIIYFKKLKFYYFENDSFNFYNPLNSRYIKIPIQEIEKFDSINYFNNDFILIIVEDEGNYLNRLEKFLAKFNKRNFGTYYCFNLNTTNLDEQKALKDLNTLKN